MATTRTFQGSRKKVPFTVKTTMTDEAAIKILAKIEGDFASDCAFEIARMREGMKAKEVLVAWGFKLASEGPRKSAAVVLPAGVLARVAFRKPLKALTPAGNPVVVRLCGPRSKHEGSYSITNGGAFGSPENAFYGYATPEGEWKPTSATPEGIVDFLTKE